MTAVGTIPTIPTARADSVELTGGEQVTEILACRHSAVYFIHKYCRIYDPDKGDWLPFHLWPAQVHTLKTVQENQLVVILKARQLGLTWLMLSYALWLITFHPAATVLLFSRREQEAYHLLERMVDVYRRLPDWLRVRVITDNASVWELSNGSVARAFPTTAGDSYTATFALADEFDLVDNQDQLISAVKPTIDMGGQMVLLSRSDKSRPMSTFKRIYQAAKVGLNNWTAVFLSWSVRPARTAEWYEKQKADSLANTGALDSLYEQYPETDVEALAPAELDKRLPASWLNKCYEPLKAILPQPPEAPSIQQLRIYREPAPGAQYRLGADPAEGNPTSDDSAVEVVDLETGEQVACLAGKYEPAVFGGHIAVVSRYFNHGSVLVERNNHGHAVIGWLHDNASDVKLLRGSDRKLGWLTTGASKTAMYDLGADAIRQGDALLHDLETYTQLALIEGASLSAPKTMPDDKATAYMLAQVARTRGERGWEPEAEAELVGFLEEW